MARVNITVPDEVLARARAAGLTISAVATAGLIAELEKRDKIAAFDRYMDELERELGPIPAGELAAADERIGQAFVVDGHAQSA